MKPQLIVVDSVAAMLPQQFLEGAIDDSQRIGLQAQLMSGMCSYISKFLQESNTCLLFLNQMRKVIKKSKFDVGPDEESSGGWALKFYSSVRIKLRKSTVEKVDVKSKLTGKKGQEPVNVMVKVTVVKNKIDKPWYSAPVYIRFGEGFDNILSIMELAINTNIIKKSGAFLTFDDVKAQGQGQMWQILHDDNKVLQRLKDNLVLVQDKQAKEDYSKFNEEIESGKEDVMGDMLGNIASTFIEKEAEKKIKKTKKEEDD
jgi:recombination protein RecA